MTCSRRTFGGGLLATAVALTQRTGVIAGKGWCSMDPVVLIDGQSVTIEGWAHTDIQHVTHAEFVFYRAPGHTLVLDPDYPSPDCPTSIVQGNFTGVRYFFTTDDGTTEGRLQVIPNEPGAVQGSDYVFQGGQTLHYLL
jgi:hypothetical protein